MTSDPTAAQFGPFDVVIAGAGLAGGSLALRLAREGVKVAVVDPSTFPRTKICGEFLSPECWEVFDNLGLTGAIEQLDYQPIHRVRISTPRGREVIAAVVGPDGRPGIGLSRSALDHLILQRAEQAGATIFEATRVSAPLVAGGRVAGISARSTVHGPITIRAKVTVGADGRQSTLVKQAGATRDRSWFRPRLFGLKRHFHLADLADGEQPGTVGLHLIPGGYGGTCRVEGDLTNLCALLPEARVRDRRGDLDRVAIDCLGLNPALGRLLAGGAGVGDWKTVAGVRVQISRPTLPGILFAGDGQGTVDPLGGQGMTMALLGSAELVPFIKAGLRREQPGVDSKIQAEWRNAWRRRFDRRIWLCRAFHHFLIHPSLTDLASILGPVGSRLLANSFGQTRDGTRRRVPAPEVV